MIQGGGVSVGVCGDSYEIIQCIRQNTIEFVLWKVNIFIKINTERDKGYNHKREIERNFGVGSVQ